MDPVVIIIVATVFVASICSAYAVGVNYGRRKQRALEMEAAMKRVQRRVTPREDAQRVTRDPTEGPKHRARVTTAHMSQPRSQWNSGS